MKTFLKMLLATILGGVILFFLSFIIIASIISMTDEEIIIDDGSVLKIDLNAVIHDRADNNPFRVFDPFSGNEHAMGLDNILASIKNAKNDERILGIYLEGGIPMSGHATLREIRNALIDFKESDKFIYHYTEIMTQKGYYIASVADSIFVNPEGFMEWSGLSASVTYYKEALDKIGLQPEVLRASGNRFKSAVEPFLMQNMSDENREQLSTLLNSVWGNYLREISESRNISTDELNTLANELVFTGPEAAAEKGLISRTAYVDEVLNKLKNFTEKEKIEDIPFVSISRYSKSSDFNSDKSYKSDRIALIIAQGEIVNGESDVYSTGGQTISEAIREARTNDKVKAVVLRINSPGGSALASEVIWREVALTQKVKPVIASMGDLAASGGYYIACFADTIVAQPNTITGSIGAFGLFFTAQELLNNKLGINIETVKTNEFSDLGTLDRPLTEKEKNLLIASVDEVYNTFKKRVADGRNLSLEYVDSIGQGRVWSGEKALELGLVDVMGGLEDAIEIARLKAGIGDEYSVVIYPELEDPFQRLIRELGGKQEARILEDKLGEYAEYIKVLEMAKNRQGLQTRMEYDLIID